MFKGMSSLIQKIPARNLLVVAQSLSPVPDLVTPWTEACQASLSFAISWSLLKLMSIESIMPSNHLILCLSLLLMPSVSFSIRVFLMSWLFTSGGQSIGASVLPMNIQDSFPLGFTGLISLQSKGLSRVFSSTTHSSKALILRCSVFFMGQLSHPYMTTRKTIALTIRIFVSKVTPLLLSHFL